jgi:hypothetical protein
MAGIKPAIEDILTQLKSIVDANNSPVFAKVSVWNNQLKYDQLGKYVAIPKPAVFIEVVSGVEYNQLGQGVQSADLGVKIHLIHEYYDSQDGDFDKNIVVYDVRDTVVNGLSYFVPAGCNELIRIGEEIDYDHDNLFHFVISFVTNLIDKTVHDYVQTKNYVIKQPPTDLEIDGYIRSNLVYQNTITVAQPTQTFSATIVNTTAQAGGVYFPVGNDGRSIAGSVIALVILDIKPLRNNQWSWDSVNGFLTITDGSVWVDDGVLITVMYTKTII